MIPKNYGSDLIAVSRLYFLRTGDRELRIWVFAPDEGDFVRPPAPEAFLRSSVHFGDEKFGIHVLNQFRTPRPYLLSYEALTGEVRIPFRPSVIMDSNLVNYIHQYVILDPGLNASRRRIIGDFLRFVVSKGIDYNGFFYYMEGVAKDEQDLSVKYATAVSESILRLHTMDRERFLASGEIVTDPKILEKYVNEYAAPNIEEIAPLYARCLSRLDPHLAAISKLVYASLLKIGLIHKSGRQSILAKYREFLLFMARTLDIAMGPESVLAPGYFAGQYDDFIPVQRGANPDRILKRLRATAWDLTLLRLPTHMLGMPIEDGVEIGYVGTSDRALSRIMGALKVESVMVFGRTFRNLPQVSYDYADLEPVVGARVIAEINEMNNAWGKSRVPRFGETGERISDDDLSVVISDLEAEMVRFCRGESGRTSGPPILREKTGSSETVATIGDSASDVAPVVPANGGIDYCDLSVDPHTVEAGDGSTISAEEIARFSNAYAHMIFDQLPEHQRREIVQNDTETLELTLFEAIARGLRVIPLDTDEPPGYQAIGNWYTCRLHRAQWETYKLRYPPSRRKFRTPQLLNRRHPARNKQL